jgi:hypothetical protein
MRNVATVVPFAVGLLGLATACGARQKQATEEAQSFDCKDRLVSYVVSHHMGGDEVGVQMDCTNGPAIKRWRIDRKGTRIDDARSLTPAEFDKVWGELAGSGWENLKDCSNGTGGDRDPVYVFDIHDDQSTASFQCQSQSMPYPYNTIVDPLDVAAQNGRGQLGDPEDDDLKKLDKKDRKK